MVIEATLITRQNYERKVIEQFISVNNYKSEIYPVIPDKQYNFNPFDEMKTEKIKYSLKIKLILSEEEQYFEPCIRGEDIWINGIKFYIGKIKYIGIDKREVKNKWK